MAPGVIDPAAALERSFGVTTIELNVIRDATRQAKRRDRDFEVKIGHPH